MNTPKLCAGYGRRDVTPTYPVPLAGYGNTHLRQSQGFYNRVYITCVALTDEQNETLLLFSTDFIHCRAFWTQTVRERLVKITGIPEQRIMLTATHNHSAPDIGGEITSSTPYFETYVQGCVDSALEALADRKPVVKAGYGQICVPKMGFVRHYIMEDGEVVGDNFGFPGDRKYAGHTMEADEQMQVIRLFREDRPDVLMVNWQAHPTVASTIGTELGRLLRPFVGADYIGACREFVEKETGCLFAYFLGGSGNLNSRSRIMEETPTTNVHEYGKQLGGYVLKALEDLTDISMGGLKTKQVSYIGQLDHTEDHLVEKATEIRKIWAETNDNRACMAAGWEHGIHSAYHAGAIIRRSKQGAEIEMELNAISLADLGIVTAPYEMFCNSGQFIKNHSPFPHTFVISCANNGIAYLASQEAFEHGCYEVDNRMLVKGTAEKLADKFVEMLTELKA